MVRLQIGNVEATMRGQIMTETETGRRWLYVPDAHIQMYAMETAELFVVAHRTDGYYRPTGEPVIDWLRRTCQFTSEVEVPKWVVDFAVESERRRQAEVGDTASIFAEVVEKGQDRLSERDLRNLLAAEEAEEDPDLDRRAALEIQRIMKEAGGQQ